ncbi:unnamed protein product [Arctia plantaginis]|uniref:Cyclic nucleotide-binding domain-containing protein n=1 Tax=Arctia plantaginis TaxID=874455 RepID=A0A8S0ZSA2_ARCPL|nr:unnamed protein product [Arctia plantaginis]
MPPKKEKLAELDPELILKKKFQAKCLFRRIVRLALANSYWLNESERYEGVDDVKKRVAQAMRKKKQTQKTLLTLADKGLLNKPAHDRTDQEKKYIYRIIGGLKCFKRYPHNVKKKLAAVTYFKYYGPGRVIVREHQSGHAMYFILSGKVSVTHLVYDGLLNIEVPVEIGDMHAGDMFGEVSLLHNIPRTATCTTADHCELLVLMKDDFKNILQATIQASWDIVRTAMSFFSYFDGLDEVSRREGCIIARMKSYDADEVIFGDNAGVRNFVYFVLSGCCQMIETMKIIETKRLGRTYYTLYDPYVAEEESDNKLDEKYFGLLARDSTETLPLSLAESSTTVAFKALDDIHQMEEMTTDEQISDVADGIRDESKSLRSAGPSSQGIKEGQESIMRVKSEIKPTILYERGQEHHRESVRFSMDQVMQGPSGQPPNMRTYFMQVCLFNPGSTFGFGENMRDRRIVALTPVECMLMPKIWLLQRNTANIWTRIRHYLEKKIPTKKQLFKVFEVERHWVEFREQLVNDVVSRCNTVNSTTVHDVPYSIRMEEMLDL